MWNPLQAFRDLLNRGQANTTPRTFFAIAAVAIGLAVGAALFILAHRTDGGFIQAPCGQLQWARSDLPIPVRYGFDLSDEWRVELQEGAKSIDPTGAWLRVDSTPTIELGAARDPVAIVGLMNAADHGTSRPHWDKDCKIRRVEVLLPAQVPPGGVRARAVAHELGHVLGLAHDDDEDSLMYPKASAVFGFALSDGDRRRLEKAYGGAK